MADGNHRNVTDLAETFGELMANPIDKIVMLFGSVNDYAYNMNYKKKGKCVIFNQEVFIEKLKLEPRKGTNVDKARLYSIFRNLGFDVRIYSDLEIREIQDKLEAAGKEDNSDYSCFVCFILSHGEDGIFFAKDGKYPIHEVFAPFLGDVCPSLRGKPKMFFIQACQGKLEVPGANVIYKQESADSCSAFKLPTYADFLVAHSTVKGHCSWRTEDGTFFIQVFCTVLDKHAQDKDILQIMTIVNRIVATGRNTYLQMPCITSTLTKDVKLS